MRSPPGASGVRVPTHPAGLAMLPLDQVLGADVARLSPQVVAFYREPERFHVLAQLFAQGFGALVLRLFALLSGQCRVLLHSESGAPLVLAQRVYRDAGGATHWDRWARLGARTFSLFTARIERGPGFMIERFDVWGFGLPIRFAARVDGDALVLESRRFLFGQHVVYRTAPVGAGLETLGELRLAWLGLHVRTRFQIQAL